MGPFSDLCFTGNPFTLFFFFFSGACHERVLVSDDKLYVRILSTEYEKLRMLLCSNIETRGNRAKGLILHLWGEGLGSSDEYLISYFRYGAVISGNSECISRTAKDFLCTA